MKKYNSYFTEVQLKAMRLISNETGLAVAELLRRAVDVYLLEYTMKRQPKEKP